MLITDAMYAVIDLETSVNNNEVGNTRAHFACKDNKIVLIGCVTHHMESDATSSIRLINPASKLILANKLILWDELPKLLIGHNITFDLLYLMRDYPEWREWMKEGKIWDTMHVHYLLSGQEDKFPSLDFLCAKYKLPTKDNRIKDMWDAGVRTEDIPIEMLSEYCKQDVENTHKIFLEQIEEVTNAGMMPLVETQMEGLLALIDMTFNGMKIDVPVLHKQRKELEDNLSKIETLIKYEMERVGIKTPNINSNNHLNLFFFGGKQKQTVAETTTQLYKSGPKKGTYKIINKEIESDIEGINNGICIGAQKGLTKNKNGYYSLDENALKHIEIFVRYNFDAFKHGYIKNIIDLLLGYRDINKQLNTYYDGVAHYVWPTGLVHPNFNTTATVTGRLSSSNPNLQNVTRASED